MPFRNNNGVPDAGFMIAKLVYDIGDVLVADDYHDYGKFDHIHHWFVGEIFRQIGKHLGGALVGMSIAEEMKNNVVEKIFPLTTNDEAMLDSIIKSCQKVLKQ
jgi:hypothetical protein